MKPAPAPSIAGSMSGLMTSPAGIRLPPRVRYRDLDDEGVLLHGETGECFALDQIANRTWQLLMQFGVLDRVTEALTTEYLAPAAAIRADVDQLVRELVDRHLIELTPTPQ